MKRSAVFVLALALLLAACSLGGEDQQTDGILLYYLTQEEDARGSDAVVGCYEQLDLPEDATPEETAAAVVERLLQGPEDALLMSPVPDDVELLSLELQGGRAYVDLSSGFNRLSGVDLTLADYCIVLSLTALEGIESVVITAEGRAIAQQPKQVFYERDVLLSTMDDVVRAVEVTLYFFDSAGALTGEARILELYEGETLAEKLLLALLEGPEDRELTTAIPEGFQLTSVHVDSGVCYVNVPASSLELLPDDKTKQEQILWSISESLYSLPSVEELCLLSEGEELTMFGEVPVDSFATRPKG